MSSTSQSASVASRRARPAMYWNGSHSARVRTGGDRRGRVRLEVVDVGRQQGHLGARCVAEEGDERVEHRQLRLAAAAAARRGCATAPLHAAVASAAAASALVRGCSAPNAGCTRLTTPATWPMPCSASWPANHAASATASWRGAATSDEHGRRRPEQGRSTSSARWRNPPSMPANAWKKATASASTSEPTTGRSPAASAASPR